MNNNRGAAYRERARSRAKTQEVTLPSGAVFILRPLEPEVFAMSGVLPFALVSKMEAAKKKGVGDEEAFNTLTDAEKDKSTNFAKKVLTYICIDPKVSENPKDDEIAIEDLEPEDLKFLLDWANGGGGAAQPGNFQPESNSVAGANG